MCILNPNIKLNSLLHTKLLVEYLMLVAHRKTEVWLNIHNALGRPLHFGEDIDEGRLPCSIPAQKGEYLPFVDSQRNRVECPLLAINFGDALKLAQPIPVNRERLLHLGVALQHMHFDLVRKLRL